MNTIEIFDRPEIAHKAGPFTQDMDWAKSQGAQIEHLDLQRDPDAASRISAHYQGMDDLPIVLVNGALKLNKRYPNRNELAEWASIPKADAVFAKVSCCSGGKCY